MLSKLLPVAIPFLVASILVGFAAPPAHMVIDTRSIPLNQPPLVENNVIMVAFPPIFRGIWLDGTWDNEKKTATPMLGNHIERVTIGHGMPAQLETTVKLINGWTMVPSSFVEQAFGVTVKWDPKAQTLTIDVPQNTQSITLGFTVSN